VAGAATALAVTFLVGVVIILLRERLFASAPGESTLAFLVALSLVMDGVQMVLGGALRGMLDARFFSLVSLACWWLFCLPLAYALAFTAGLGIHGIWAALCATLLLCASIFARRLLGRWRLAPVAEAPE
jgi:MATE family multidrug resistance protein